MPDSGRILIDDVVVADPATNTDVPPDQRGLGVVFQDYAVWPHMTVFDNIAYPLKLKNIENTVFYSDPLSEDVEGVDYDYTGYVNKDFLKDNVNLNSDFYLCGPPPFMKAVESILLELGVDNSKINYELFSN